MIFGILSSVFAVCFALIALMLILQHVRARLFAKVLKKYLVDRDVDVSKSTEFFLESAPFDFDFEEMIIFRSRPMTGFFATLTDEQKEKILGRKKD